MQDFDYDRIVIGFGFGGRVSTLRVTEKGYPVAVLESGRRYADWKFAKSIWDLKRFRLFSQSYESRSTLDNLNNPGKPVLRSRPSKLCALPFRPRIWGNLIWCFPNGRADTSGLAHKTVTLPR